MAAASATNQITPATLAKCIDWFTIIILIDWSFFWFSLIRALASHSNNFRDGESGRAFGGTAPSRADRCSTIAASCSTTISRLDWRNANDCGNSDAGVLWRAIPSPISHNFGIFTSSTPTTHAATFATTSSDNSATCATFNSTTNANGEYHYKNKYGWVSYCF